VVSKLNLQEVENAVAQANKEIGTRFDFKGSVSRMDWDKKEVVTLYSDDDQKLKSVIDILAKQAREARRSPSKRSITRRPDIITAMHTGATVIQFRCHKMKP